MLFYFCVTVPRAAGAHRIGLATPQAALAQLGERQTEDLKVPGSIPGGGTRFCKKRGQGGIEPPTSPTLRENHATRPLALIGWGKAPPPGLEPGTYRLTAERSAN